jgi:tetratricopeptide (TPR) repeat protein
MNAYSTWESEAEARVKEGTELEMRGALAEAELHYRAALEVCRGTGVRPERAALVNLAKFCADGEREFEALSLSRRAAVLCEGARDYWGLYLSRLHLANALYRIEDFNRVAPVLDSIEADLHHLNEAQQQRIRLSLVHHRGRLASRLGDVERADAFIAQSDDKHISWIVRVQARIAAGRFEEACTFLENVPDVEPGRVRRRLELDYYRVRCLLGTQPERVGLDAAKALLEGLRDAPFGTVGSAWRLKIAAEIGEILGKRFGPVVETRLAWDLAGQAVLERLVEIESFVASVPEISDSDPQVLELLKEYRGRFRDRHDALMKEVAGVFSAAADAGTLPLDGLVPDHGLTPVCAWCARVRTPSRLWIPVRQFLPDGPLLITHTICSDCRPMVFPESVS